MVLPDILHGTGKRETICGFVASRKLHREIGIGKPVAKRIQHIFFGKGFKPTVADENILGIEIVIFAAEIRRRRIFFIGFCHGIGQFAARRRVPRKQIRRGIAAFHTALPQKQNRVDFAVECIHPRQIHHTADIEKHHGFLKMRSNKREHLPFCVG